jgi:3-dehydroquinate dehydratase II
MQKILLINGPNLNLLGSRETEIYGKEDYQNIIKRLTQYSLTNGFELIEKQSNHEGEIIDWIQEIHQDNDFIAVIINPAAYTHTSIAILDALKLLTIPIIEIHISNPEEREEYRKFSFVSEVAKIKIQGEGVNGYFKAIDKIKALLTNEPQ